MTRSGYARFFLLLVYGAVGFLHVYYHGNRIPGVTLSLTCTSSLIPYTNVYLFTFLLLVPVAFWVDSLTRRQQGRPGPVFHARPAGNGAYVLGIAWGASRVVLAAGAASLCVGAAVNLLASGFPFNGWIYLFYLVTLLVPSFVFIVGAAVFTGTVIRHRGAGALVLSGVIVLAFFPRAVALDPLGITLAGAFSDVTGLAGAGEFLVQRAGWLLAGCGLAGFAVAAFDRLPNVPRSPGRARGVALSFLLAGACCCGYIVLAGLERSGRREAYIATYAKYQAGEKLTLTRQSIRFAREEGEARARSRMTVVNRGTGPVERPVFYLNPSLRLSAARVNGEEVAFERENQAVILSRAAGPGEAWEVEMEYAGGIDESVCYLDVPDERLRAPFPRAHGECRGGERHAFLEEDFVLLTPECLWYPVTVPPVNPASVFDTREDFAEYSLEVVEGAGNTVISRGERSVSGDTVSFRDEHPAPGLSLCIGPYASYPVSAGGVEFELFLFRGHESLLDGLELLREEGERIIRRLMAQLDEAPYPSRRLRIAEVPLSFDGPYRLQRGASEFVQPGIVFLPERLHAMHGANFAGFLAMARRDKQAFGHLEERSDAEVMEMIVDNFVKNNFLEEVTVRMTGHALLPVRPRMELNPYNLSALFHQHAGYVHSADFPVMNALLHFVSKRRDAKERELELTTDIFNARGPSVARGLEERGLEGYLNDPGNDPVATYNAWKRKARELVARVSAGIPGEELAGFAGDYLSARPFRRVEFDDFNRACRERLGVDWKEVLPAWYAGAGFPAFVIRDFTVGPVEDNGGNPLPLKRVCFRAYNDGEADGVITAIIRFRGLAIETMTRDYTIPRGEGREVAFVVDDRAAAFLLKMDLSRNIPWVRSFTPSPGSPLSPPSREIASRFARVDPGYFSTAPGEIIVDNEDEGFQARDASSGRWFSSARTAKKDASRAAYLPEELSRETWQTRVIPGVHGEYRLTAAVKRAGSGRASAGWTATIAEPGEHELFAYVLPVLNGSSEPATYRQYYTVTHAGGTEEVFLDYAYKLLAPGDWISLGRFTLPRGECKVVLSDRGDSSLQVIYADAVKWVAVGRKR